MLKVFGIKLRNLPIGSTVDRLVACKVGTVNFFIGSSDVMYARRGWSDYGARQIGPTLVKQIWQVNKESAFGMAVAATSDIKKLSDLKGKKVGYIIGSPSVTAQMTGMLNFGGLTWRDVDRVDFPSYGTGAVALRDGKIDAFALDTMSSFAFAMEASPTGLRWLQTPTREQDPKGWEFAHSVHPVGPGYAIAGAGITKEKPVHLGVYCFPNLFCMDWLDENIAYWQTKAIVESYDEYKDAGAFGPWWQVDTSLEVEFAYAPYHPGAIRYLKEIGKWTEQHEAWNQTLIDDDAKIQPLWEAAVEEGYAQKVKVGDWINFWYDKCEAAGLPTPKVLQKYE